jgi:hypothetical protein
LKRPKLARRLAPVFLVLAAVLLSGCAQLDSAKGELEEARQGLAEAQREAQEARDRYDRVKSATIVRTERVDATAWPLIENGTLRFDVEAARGTVAIPRANLTAMEPLAVRVGNATLWCDPLTCEIGLPPEGVELSWQGGEPWAHYPQTTVCADRGALPERCGQPPLSKKDAEARVTTAVSDMTA